MECKYSEYDAQDIRYVCNIIEGECIFSVPDPRLCCEIFGEEEEK